MATKAPTRISATTSITADKTEADIKAYLRTRKAEQVFIAQNDDTHQIVASFRLFGRVIQMEQTLLAEDHPSMTKPGAPNQYARTPKERAAIRVEAETRRRWRVMFLRVKLRLDLVFDEQDLAEREEVFLREFLVDTVIPGGGTVAQFMEPQVAEAYRTGKSPQLLPAPGAFRLLEDK